MTSAISAALDQLFARYATNSGPGFSIAIDRAGERFFQAAYGLASVEGSTPFRIHTRSRIGSTTKQFACAAILRLEARGLLHRDEPVKRHIAELPDLFPAPTIHHLMNSSSGLRDHLDLTLLFNGLSPVPGAEIDRIAFARSGTNFAAGERFLYCNLGFALLGRIVERVSARTLEDFLAEEFFAPAGMIDTALHRSDFDMLPGLAAAHIARPDGGFSRGLFPTPIGGEGGIVSTVADLLAWSTYLERPENRALRDTLTERARYTNGATGNYGCGLILDRYRGLKRIHHPGGVIGASAQLLILPELNLRVAVLSNSSAIPAADIADHAVDALLEEGRPRPDPVYVPAAGEAVLDGFYHHPQSARLLSIVSDSTGTFVDHLTLRIPITRRSSGLFFSRPGMSEVRVVPSGEEAGEPTAMILHDCGHADHFTRVRPEPRPAPTRVAFHNAELAATAELQLAGGAGTPETQGRYGRVVYQLDNVGPDLWRARPDGVPTWALLALGENGCSLTTPRNWQIALEAVRR